MSPNDKRPRILSVVRPGRPPGVPAPDPVVGGSLRFEADSLDRPTVERQRITTLPERLSPAAVRCLGAAVGDLAESLGGSLSSPPTFDTSCQPDGTVTITLTLRANLAALNEHAAERATDSNPR